MRIVQAGLRAFALPLVRPLETAHGPIAERAGHVVTLVDEDGRIGIGEATPLPDFGGEDLASCRAALERALAALVRTPRAREGSGEHATTALARLRATLAVCCAGTPVARAALEAALADLAAQHAGLSLAHWLRQQAGLPGPPPEDVVCHALVSGAAPEEVAASGRRARDAGFTAVKLKLAVRSRARVAARDGDAGARAALARDLERVAALREAVGPAVRIRLDANEAWSRGEAERAFAQLAPYDIEYVEQPLPRRDIEGLAALDRDGPIAIAADESLIEPGVEACLAARVARIFVVKQAVLGGIGPTLALAARAREAGIRLVHSNLIDGRIGRATALALAAALTEPQPDRPQLQTPVQAQRQTPAPAAHGLATADWLARDLDDVGMGAADIGVADARFEADWLAWTLDRHAARAALVFGQRTWSYGALAAAARAACEALERAGIGAGDRVAVLAPPSPYGVTLFHALLERRAILLPLNARLTEPELLQVLETTRPAALLVDAAIEPALARRLGEASGVALHRLVAASAVDALGCALEPIERSRRAEHDADRMPRDPAVLAVLGAALVLMTSGTSGRAKAAVLTRANLVASARASAQLLGSTADDRWLLCMPLFHIGGLSILVRAALAGACVVLEPRFDAVRVADALDAERITHVSLVATTLAQLLEARAKRGRPSCLRLALLGGGPAPDALLARARAAGIPIAPTYGLTEAASQVATRPPGERGPGVSADADVALDADADLAGGLVPLPGIAVRIVDVTGAEVAAGEEGEIEVAGPTVMHGYLDDPEATARVLRDGWLATGDVGRLDAQGRLRVLDRRGDLIVSGGENVYPAEIEAVLAAHPDVVEAGVVGVPDARFGARPLAFVVWRGGATADPAALAAWCRARLAGYKQPVGFVALAALPRNASGKLLRRALAEEGALRGSPY